MGRGCTIKIFSVFAMLAHGVCAPLVCAGNQETIFAIGKPDARAAEFKFFRGLDDDFKRVKYHDTLKYRNLDKSLEFFKNPPLFKAGKSSDKEWSFIHPVGNCDWAGIKEPAVLKIQFDKPAADKAKLYLKIGFADSSFDNRIGIAVKLNGKQLAEKRGFFAFGKEGGGIKMQNTLAYHEGAQNATSVPFTVEISADSLKPEGNIIELCGLMPKKNPGARPLWLVYDFIELSTSPRYPAAIDAAAGLLKRAIKAMGGEEVVFCVSGGTRGGHWYENIGTLCRDNTDNEQIQMRQGRENFSRLGGRLVRLNIRTGEYKVLLEDDEGGIRDARVHYDGKKILFSYRKGGESQYKLHEIGADGKNLARLPIDTGSNDVEPCYLPNDDIMYVSDRMNRTVQCWMSPTLNLHRYFRRANAVVCMSGNPDVDNTPTVLPDGRVLYMRWDYNHRDQNNFHHLWSINPDGSNNTIFYGNAFSSGVFLYAHQIPDGETIVFTASPGHGMTNNRGAIAKLEPNFDPSDPYAYKYVEAPHNRNKYYEPYPIGDNLVLATDGANIVVMDLNGVNIKIPIPHELFRTQRESITFPISYEFTKRQWKCQMIARSAVPLAKRKRENIRPDMADFTKKTATVFLQDVYEGREMKTVKRGSIKKLLITRVQPATVNYHGGYAPTGIGGTFALEEVEGTVPVYEDGSAFFEVPALVGLAFAALDENGNCVKKMMSSTNFSPGTSTSCIGCHENRTMAPPRKQKPPIAYRRGVSKIEKIPGAKNIIDFARDIQPMLDKYCVPCHNPSNPKGKGVILSFGVGMEHISSRLVLQANDMCSTDYNNFGSLPPYKFGSGDSRLARFAEGKHRNKKFSGQDLAILKAWLDCGAPHISAYAAKGTGFPIMNRLRTRINCIKPGNPMHKVQAKLCNRCHNTKQTRGAHKNFVYDYCVLMKAKKSDGKIVQLRTPREIIFNFIDPENSPALLVPLAKSAGGSAEGEAKGSHPVIFKSKDDPNFQEMLTGIKIVAADLDKNNPFLTSKNFRPSFGYIHQMKKCKILPQNWDALKPLDAYQIDNAYFRWQEKNAVVKASKK